MNTRNDNVSTTHYRAREAVAVFAAADALEAAIDRLGLIGVDRSAISVLGTDAASGEWSGRRQGAPANVADAQRGPFVSTDTRTEGKAAAIAAPMYVAGIAGAFVVAASGGTLAAAAAAAVAAGAAGGGLGGLIAAAVERQHAQYVTEQVSRGGLVLWVGVPDPQIEQRVCDALRVAGAQHVHVYESDRTWGAEDRPLGDVQPDPFLDRKR